jgi:hypothetical protein
VLLLKEERDVASACVRAGRAARERWQSACERRSAHKRWSLGAHAKTVSVRLGHNARVRACGGAALQVMLAARHGDPAVGVGCRAREPSDAWERGSRRDAMHECMRHERGHMHGSQASSQMLTDKRRIPLRSASVRTPHLFHHGIPKVLVNPRSKGITSVRSTTTH